MDCNPELIAAALENNTANLGFSDRFALHTGELADTRFLENLRMEASSPGPVGHGEPAVASCRLRTLTRNRGPPKSLIRG